ncbi:MAG: hypothetical protein RL161_268 [Bacteroidota bacterium]|jgi:hypothetical protein
METKTLTRLNLFILAVIISSVAWAQPQVVLLRNETALIRLEQGDTFKIRLDGEKRVYEDILVSAWEFGIIGLKDSVKFTDITHIHSGGRSTFLSRLGGGLMVAGLGYFLIDQINEGIFSGNDFSLEERVWKPALGLLGAGAIFQVARKRWYTPGLGRLKLITAQPDSPFYRSVDY